MLNTSGSSSGISSSGSGSSKKHSNLVAAKKKSGPSAADAVCFGGGGSVDSGAIGKARKRKHCDVENELKREFNGMLMEDAVAMEKRLRKVAEVNSLSDDEMRKLLRKCVRNDHILALVTLKAEDELAREKREAEQRAFIITDTPSVAKLTRAKARELNKTPSLPVSTDLTGEDSDIAALIADDLHSDDEDEEYTFKEEDFVSDDDPNMTASDLESNPRTPKTPGTQTDYEDSPVKYTADGCFKVPFDRRRDSETTEDLRIAARTRSKLCLEKTTIEDIQSEFVPPDVEHTDDDLNETDFSPLDADWMQFLNDFSKPLNTNVANDDDDPINDPEYVAAADHNDLDAEELRDINISKKELNDLVAELFEDLVADGLLLESVDLQTPQKILQQDNTDDTSIIETTANVDAKSISELPTSYVEFDTQNCISDATITSTNIIQSDYTPRKNNNALTDENDSAASKNMNDIPKSNGVFDATVAPVHEKIDNYDNTMHTHASNGIVSHSDVSRVENYPIEDDRYQMPYDYNYTCGYISIRRHVLSEYKEKFEQLRNVKIPEKNPILSHVDQQKILQQQMRIHVQFLTQHFVQTYSHPEFWKFAPKCKEMLTELHTKSKTDARYRIANLESAVTLISQWEDELSSDTKENTEMMNFIHAEIDKTNYNARQVPRFPPRIMNLILNSNVFMYPQYMPRIPFTPKVITYQAFAPSEAQLIVFGIEKHIRRLVDDDEKISKKTEPINVACKRIVGDTVFGKDYRRIWDYVKYLKSTKYYNPVQYYFDHQCAPPIRHEILPIDKLHLPPRYRYDELSVMWQEYIRTQNIGYTLGEKRKLKCTKVKATRRASECYEKFVQEVLGEDNGVPGIIDAAIVAAKEQREPNDISNDLNSTRRSKGKGDQPLTINVNYFFGANIDFNNTPLNSTFESSSRALPNWVQTTSPNRSTIVISEAAQSHYDTDITSNENPSELCDTTLVAKTVPVKVDCEDARDAIEVISGRPLKQRINYKTPTLLIHRNRRVGKQKYRRTLSLSRKCRQLLVAYGKVLQAHQERYAFCAIVQTYYSSFKALELYSNLLTDLEMFCRNALTARISPSATNTTSAGGSGSPSLGKRSRSTVPTISTDDDANTLARSKKPNRQEENFRHMILPDTAEDGNRKDAIFAYNFYEKVEEVLKSSKRPEDWKKFNQILKSFNPTRDKVCDLYQKMEKLFVPDHPELAEVFLSFLLPAQAAEVGKFFEHFMIVNVVTFINKLNVYFNKQPAQIRKIYNCLNELACDPDVTVKKAEAKILPLLKGNRVLIDWFMQQFPQEPPPDRLLPDPENVNLKEVLDNQSGDYLEHHTMNLLDSPTQENQQHNGCQLRYINGRIFYGTKITLPAKLSFMAANYKYPNNGGGEGVEGENLENRTNNCIHAIREHGEKRLLAAAACTVPSECNGDDTHDRPEEEECSQTLASKSTATTSARATALGGEDECCSASIETCDDATLRAHAIRLNPNYYGNTCFNSTSASGTSNSNNNASQQLTTAGGSSYALKKPNAASTPTSDECRTSPRKNQAALNAMSALPLPSPISACLSPNVNTSSSSSGSSNTTLSPGGANSTITTTATCRDKRKSPTKKNRSPIGNAKGRAVSSVPMVVIHEQTRPMTTKTSTAIECAKKLKSLIDNATSVERERGIDNEKYTKMQIPIVARTKKSLEQSRQKQQPKVQTNEQHSDEAGAYKLDCQLKIEKSDSLELTNNSADCTDADVTVANAAIKSSPDSSMMTNSMTATQADSDDEYKYDINTPLNTFDVTTTTTMTTTTTAPEKPTTTATSAKSECADATDINCIDRCKSPPVAFTRDEDKVILIEMKAGSEDLFQRIHCKLTHRTFEQIKDRHTFLMEFLSKLQACNNTK